MSFIVFCVTLQNLDGSCLKFGIMSRVIYSTHQENVIESILLLTQETPGRTGRTQAGPAWFGQNRGSVLGFYSGQEVGLEKGSPKAAGLNFQPKNETHESFLISLSCGIKEERKGGLRHESAVIKTGVSLFITTHTTFLGMFDVFLTGTKR